MMVGTLARRGSLRAATEVADCLNEAVSHGIPGISVAIATGEGLLWTGTPGVARFGRSEPVRPEMLFGIGSITKTFVAVVILQLVQEGRLCLDATAASILGVAVKDIANADRATISHLLNHSSGIPSWEHDPAWIREGRGDLLEIKRLWGKEDTLRYITGR